MRVLAPVPGAEVIHHPGPRIEGSPRVGPHVSLPGLACAGVQQRHGRLIGVHHARAEHESPVRLIGVDLFSVSKVPVWIRALGKYSVDP